MQDERISAITKHACLERQPDGLFTFGRKIIIELTSVTLHVQQRPSQLGIYDIYRLLYNLHKDDILFKVNTHLFVPEV